MYKIGDIFNFNGANRTGLLVGYLFDPENKTPDYNVLLIFSRDAGRNGEFTIQFYSTYFLTVSSEFKGHCDISAFTKLSKHLDIMHEVYKKKLDGLQTDLDAMRYLNDELEDQWQKLKE